MNTYMIWKSGKLTTIRADEYIIEKGEYIFICDGLRMWWELKRLVDRIEKL